MTPEGKVKKRVVDILGKLQVERGIQLYVIKPNTGGYGVSGAPDIIVLAKGKFIGIECKSGNNTPTLLQRKHLAEIVLAGGHAFVDNEDSLDQFKEQLWKIVQ